MAVHIFAWIETFLLFILLSGVVYVIKEVIKCFFDRQALKNELAELQSGLDKYQKKANESLTQYEVKISDLKNQVAEFKASNTKIMEQSEQDVAQIMSLVNNFADLNDLLLLKISAIDQSLSPEKTVSDQQLNELKEILQNDIDQKSELKKQMEAYRQAVLDRTNKMPLKEKFRGMELEP